MKRRSEMPGGAVSRRQLLVRGMFGAGCMGLQSLASGLPTALLGWVMATPRRGAAAAQDSLGTSPAPDVTCSDRAGAQYLVFSTSIDGDPVNTNAPGTYEQAGVSHPKDAQMAPTQFTLAGQNVTAARPWSTLPQKVLDRTCFFHLATKTNAHPHLPKVLRLWAAGQAEMLPSLIARYTSGCLGTAQKEPVSIGAAAPAGRNSSILTYEGHGLAHLTPSELRDLLTVPGGPLATLGEQRDQVLGKLLPIVREHGSRTLAGQLEERALSKRQAKALGDQLRADLASIRDDGPEAQILATVALLRMNVTPVVTLRISFGGDNHFDYGLQKEAAGTVAGVGQVALLMQKLSQYGLADRTSFALLNAFGRTLRKRGIAGREHWAHHHTGLLVGKPFRGSVVGGIAPGEGDFCALPIDSQSGRGAADGDIPANESLAAFARTLARGVGLPEALLATTLPPGKFVRAALSKP